MENETTTQEADTVQHLHKAIYALIGGLILLSVSGIWVSSMNSIRTEGDAKMALEMAKTNALEIARNRQEWMEKVSELKDEVRDIGAGVSGITKIIETLAISQTKMARDVKESRQWQLSRQRLIDGILDRNTRKGKL